MITFVIKLAKIPIEINAAYDSTKELCKDFLSDETPRIFVTVKKEDIENMRVKNEKAAVFEGRTDEVYSDNYLEFLALADVILEKLIEHNVLMMHGAVIAVNEKAYIFTAKSGTGKTTHLGYWLKNIPKCHILNGDKPLILLEDGTIYVCGSPWMGKEQYGVNEILPLDGTCFLDRGITNSIDKISLKSVLPILFSQFHIPKGNSNLLKAVNIIKMFSKTEMYRLHCTMSDDAALLSYKTMVKK